MVRFDPLTNLGTSQVFCQILKGQKNPKAIADALGIQPPPIIQQLRRLQKIGVVKLGKKEGKLQNYDIDFEKFLVMFIRRAIREKTTHPSFLYPDEIKELWSLKDDKYFKEFVTNYLKHLSSTETIDRAAREFEDGLLHSATLKRKKEFSDVEKQRFFDKMRLWRKTTEKRLTYNELNLQDALARTLNPKRFKDEL